MLDSWASMSGTKGRNVWSSKEQPTNCETHDHICAQSQVHKMPITLTEEHRDSTVTLWDCFLCRT